VRPGVQMKVAGAEEPAKTNKIKLVATRDFGEPAVEERS